MRIPRSMRGLLLLALTTVGPTAVLAQTADEPTRESVLDAAREAKGAATAAPERTTVERALYWYDNQYLLEKIFGGWKGIHFAGGGFPAGAGMKYGVGYSHGFGPETTKPAPNHVSLETVAAFSSLGYRRASAAVNVGRLVGKPIYVRVRGEYSDFPQEDFFGVGADSLESNRTSYSLESTEVGADLRWRPTRLVALSSGVSYLTPTAGAGTDPRFPSIEQVFDPATLAGAGERTEFVRSDASAVLDWRENPLHPHAGGRYA